MRPFVELYINDQKVYFKEPPEIFITYAHTDLHNPTVVKNSFSKTITVEGTPENNRIFNNFYDMRRINSDGLWEDVYAPTSLIRPNKYKTDPSDLVWWTKATQFPINAEIQVQGLLRPATLMQYVRLNVVFPGGHKHLSSGLYIVTRQLDVLNGNGYATTLNLTRIKGDTATPTIGAAVSYGLVSGVAKAVNSLK